MVNIEYIEGQNTFQINNVTLVRNFHSYVAGTKIRVVNAYDTTDELLPYTLFSEISVNGVVYKSTIELAEILSPILFLKQGGSGTGTGGVTTYSGNIITKTVAVPIDWTLIPETQIVDFVNAQEFAVFSTQRILFKAVRITGDLTTSNSSETYFWEFKPGKGNYGVNGTPVTVNDIEYISYVTNYQNNVIDLGEIGSTPIEVFVNDSGPYALSSSALNIFKATRSSTPVNYIYIGSAINIGTGATQSVSSDYIDVNAEPVSDPARVDGVGLLYDWSGTSLGVKREDDASFVYTDLIGPPGPPGVGGSGITKRYLTYAALVADQANQTDKGIYHASDASGFSTVDAGYADFEYLGTTLGTEADYRKLSEEESMDIVAGGVQSVTGTAVDNTDPKNPIVNVPVSGSDFEVLAYNATIAWDMLSKISPKAKVDATGNFTLNLTNLNTAANGFFKVLKSTASDVIITLDTNFQHKEKKGQGVISSITLSGVSGSEYILEFISDGTGIYWDTLTGAAGSEIAANSITYNKIQKMAANTLIGNTSDLEADAGEVLLKPRIATTPTGTWNDGISTVTGIDGQVSNDSTYLYFCNFTDKWYRVEKAGLNNSYTIISQVTIDVKNHTKATINLDLQVNLSLDYSAAIEGGTYIFVITQSTATPRTITFAASKWQKASGLTIPTPFPTAAQNSKDALICKYVAGKMLITQIISNITTI